MRHRHRLILDTRPAIESEWQRDLGHLQNVPSPWISHPMAAQRYPAHYEIAGTAGTSDNARQFSDTTLLKPGPGEPEDATSDDSMISLPEVESADLHMLASIESCFSPEIVTIEFESEASWTGLHQTIEWVRSCPDLLIDFQNCNPSPSGRSGPTEDSGSKALVSLMNEIAWRLSEQQGEKGHLFFFHGTRVYDSVTTGDLEPQDDNKSDIGVLDQAISPEDYKKNPTIPFDRVRSIGERQKSPKTDFRTGHVTGTLLNFNVLPVGQMLRGIRRVIGNNPATGRVIGFTNCGTIIRLWIVEASGMASTLSCDISKAEHAEDFVKMVAVLSGPLDQVMEIWQPSDGGFTTERASAVEQWEWVKDNDGTPFKAIYTRPQLFGRRSVIFHGMARRRYTKEKPVSMMLKCVWLLSDLETHELDILDKLNNPPVAFTVQDGAETLMNTDESLRDGDSDRPAKAKERCLNQAEIDAYMSIIDPEVKKAIPKACGVVEFKRKLVTLLGNPRELTGDKSKSRLHFTCIAIEQDLLTRIDEKTSVLELWNMLGHVYQGLFYASLHGVHHRDANMGNMMIRTVSGRKYGALLDFGNSTLSGDRWYASHPDAIEQLEDACRSANSTYWCCAVATANEIWRINRDNPGSYGKREIERLKATFQHRYIDDLESFLYCHYHYASLITGGAGKTKKTYGEEVQRNQSLTQLSTFASKYSAHHSDLKYIVRYINHKGLDERESTMMRRWRAHAPKLAENLRLLRDKLIIKDIPKALTYTEASTFASAIRFISDNQLQSDEPVFRAAISRTAA